MDRGSIPRGSTNQEEGGFIMYSTKIPGGWIFFETDDDRRRLVDEALNRKNHPVISAAQLKRLKALRVEL